MSTRAGGKSPRLDTDPRMRRRREGVRRHYRRKAVTVAAAVAMVAATAWVVVWSPLLRVSDVVVEGAKRTPEQAVVDAAALGREDHLLLLPADDIRRRVEDLPWVRRAEIDRMLPGRVRITIAERSAAVALVSGHQEWTLDATGRVLQSGKATPGLPVLTAAPVGEVRVGAPVAARTVADALRAWRSLPRAVKGDVEGIVAPTIERITFVLADGLQIRYGAAEQLRAKNAVLVAVLDDLASEGQQVAYVDVRVPANPAVGPAPSAPSTATADPTPTPSG